MSGDGCTNELRISVVIATYRSGPELEDRVFASLDAQTLPAEQFEVIAVDDGSGDDTVSRLHALAASRPHMRVVELEHSGWPSRPRNAGIDLARGEYVMFVDHDDALYPEALAAATEMARRHRLDFLNPKEVSITGSPGWGWHRFAADRVAGRDQRDPTLMIPSMPHKLYRTDFLHEHGIRFPEGRDVHWEDRIFNADVLARLDRMGVLSSVPCYQWHETGRNSSDAYVGDQRNWDLDTYWPTLTALFDHFADVLDPEQVDALRVIELRQRVLAQWVGPRTLGEGVDPARVERSRTLLRGFLDRHGPPRLDAALEPIHRARAALLRAEDEVGMWALAAEDAEVVARSTLTAGEVDAEGRIRLCATTRWLRRDGGPLTLVRGADGRLLRHLPPDLAARLPEDVLDVTAALDDTRATFVLRDQERLDAYPVPATVTSVRLVPTADPARVAVEVDAEAVIEPATGRLGRSLAGRTWEIGLRCELLGFFHARAPRSTLAPAGRVVDGDLVVVDRDKHRPMLRCGAPGRLWRLARLEDAAVSAVRSRSAALRVTVALPSLGVVGEAALPCAVVLVAADGTRSRLPGSIRPDGSGGARLEASGDVPPGEYGVVLRHRGQGHALRQRLRVRRWRQPAVVQEAERAE